MTGQPISRGSSKRHLGSLKRHTELPGPMTYQQEGIRRREDVPRYQWHLWSVEVPCFTQRYASIQREIIKRAIFAKNC